MLNSIKKFFLKKKIYNKKLLLAISGGIDSMVLFDIIKKIFNNYNLGVIYCFFNINKKNNNFFFLRRICKKNKIFFFF
ncbi:MAG: hypothetical protein NHF95_00800 [Candidatus Shikimatogenerans sp. JK-2022]|nr:hypothetical protein [Candidatus Shikimatogenerans bostrichidophilus]